MNYDIEKCGKRIRQLRIQKGLTQEKTANALNIDQSFYGRVETGKKGLLCRYVHTAFHLIRCVAGLSDFGQMPWGAA